MLFFLLYIFTHFYLFSYSVKKNISYLLPFFYFSYISNTSLINVDKAITASLVSHEDWETFFFLSINFAYPRWEPDWQRKEKLEFFQSFLHLGLTIFLSSIHFWMEKEENNVFFTHKDKNTFSYIAFHSLFRVINLNFN